MGFDAPDGDNFQIPVSDTQAYRQFGNSVVVPVVKAVAAYMEGSLRRVLTSEPASSKPLPAATQNRVQEIIRQFG